MTAAKGKGFLRRVLFSLLLPVLIYAVMSVLRPDIYLKGSTFVTLVRQSIIYTLVGWSMLFGMSCGLFDFSVGARYLLSAMFGIWLSQSWGLPGFIIGTVGGSVILAALTGGIYAGLKIPSIITGFSALLIFEALSVMFRNTFKVVVTDEISVFARGNGLYLTALFTGVLVYILFNYTKFGYQIKAIGGNEKVARSMGIKAVRLKLLTYIVGGLILGLAGLAKVGSDQAVSASTNMASMSAAFTPMMGVMIGMYLSSCNPVIGTWIGAFCIAVVASALTALGIDYRLQNVVIGIFLIVFIGLKTNMVNIEKLIGRNKAVKA